jgi:aminopeptidase N
MPARRATAALPVWFRFRVERQCLAAAGECAALLALALALACRAPGASGGRAEFPRARAHSPRVLEVDVRAYDLALELQPEARLLRGECRVRFAPRLDGLTELRLDLAGLGVEGVQDGAGRVLAFRQARDELVVALAEPLVLGSEAEVAVRYGGAPRYGLWFSGTRPDGSGPTVAFTHGQSQASRGWFPCVDAPAERAALALELDVPACWSVLGPGARVEEREEGGRRYERWVLESEIPAYLASFVAGELVAREGQAGSVPLVFLAEPRFEDWLAPTFEETDEILAFLEHWTALPFPYPKYGQAAVDNFPWGGMENASATTLTPLLLTDDRGRRDRSPHVLIAHEAAHQWFGDLVTCADWSHLWLNEGFATYLALLYVEHSRGLDEFRCELREAQEVYLAEDVGRARRPTVWNVWREPDDVFDTRAYQGAAARLHLLRFVLGDEAFLAGVRAYLREHAGGGVVTDDLRRALENASGRDLGPFFEQWLARPGFPEFRFAWEWDGAAQELVLSIEQIQSSRDGTPAVFALPVELEVRDAHGARSLRLELDERRERVRLPAPERPLYVRFDAHGWIPKRLREEKPAAEWLALARHCTDVNARREALLRLGRVVAVARERGQIHEAELAALCDLLQRDPSRWVRAEAAAALGIAGGREAEDALRAAALSDPEARAQAAALRALRAFGPDGGRSALAEDVFHGAPSYEVMAAAAGLLAAADPGRAFEFLTGALELESPHDVLAERLLAELGALADPRVPAELARWAAEPALAPTARGAALEALARATEDRRAGARFVAPFLEYPSFHLRRSALRALVALDHEAARRILLEYHPRARTPEERRLVEGAFDADVWSRHVDP